MKFYNGPQLGDERPEGGGKHNLDKIGHEAFNFFDFEGTLYGIVGIVRAHVKNPKMDLGKIDPAKRGKPELDRTLVIFVAPCEDEGGMRIVGWYRDATVHSKSTPYPEKVRQRIERHFSDQGKGIDPSFSEYRFKANREKAVLLPVASRPSSPLIPKGKGGMGQSNVCYAYARGIPKESEWIQVAIDFVNNYHGRNLLNEGG